MRELKSILLFLTPLLYSTNVLPAISDSQYQSIQSLGRLNGVALQCGYLEQTQRMKRALIDHLPKRRELGLAFDQMSHESFLEFIRAGHSCPPAGEFSRQVGQAIETLKVRFK